MAQAFGEGSQAGKAYEAYKEEYLDPYMYWTAHLMSSVPFFNKRFPDKAIAILFGRRANPARCGIRPSPFRDLTLGLKFIF